MKKKKIPTKEIAILGLLFQKSKYGYELDREIEQTSMRDWTDIAFSSIYYILNKLESKDYIASHMETQTKAPNRKMYSITETGRKYLHDELLNILSNYQSIKWTIDLGLANVEVLTISERKKALLNYRSSVQKQLKGYKNLVEYLKKQFCSVNRLQLAERPIFLLNAELKWIDSYLLKLT